MAELEPLAAIVEREQEHMQLQRQKHRQERRGQIFSYMIAALLTSGDNDVESIPGDVEEYIFLLAHDGGKRWEQMNRALAILSRPGAARQLARTHSKKRA